MNRTLWVYDGAQQSFEPPSKERSFQVMASGYSFHDAFFLRTAVQGDTGPIEFGVQASRLFSLGLGADSATLRSAVLPLETILGVELARNYRSDSGYHGRLAVSYLHALPDRSLGVQVQIDTGILANRQTPWTFRLRLSLLIPTEGEDLIFNGRIETLHSVTPEEKVGFEWGGAIGFGYLIYGQDLPTGRFEKHLFTLGPVARWRTGDFGTITAATVWRIWVDDELVTLAAKPVRTSPSEAGALPDLQVMWSVEF